MFKAIYSLGKLKDLFFARSRERSKAWRGLEVNLLLQRGLKKGTFDVHAIDTKVFSGSNTQVIT